MHRVRNGVLHTDAGILAQFWGWGLWAAYLIAGTWVMMSTVVMYGALRSLIRHRSRR